MKGFRSEDGYGGIRASDDRLVCDLCLQKFIDRNDVYHLKDTAEPVVTEPTKNPRYGPIIFGYSQPTLMTSLRKVCLRCLMKQKLRNWSPQAVEEIVADEDLSRALHAVAQVKELHRLKSWDPERVPYAELDAAVERAQKEYATWTRGGYPPGVW